MKPAAYTTPRQIEAMHNRAAWKAHHGWADLPKQRAVYDRMNVAKMVHEAKAFAAAENKACALKNGATSALEQSLNGMRAHYFTNRAREARLDTFVALAAQSPVTLWEVAEALKLTIDTVEDYARELRVAGRIDADRCAGGVRFWRYHARQEAAE